MKKVTPFLFLFVFATFTLGQSYSVTFNVNMKVQKDYGLFDPAKCLLKVRGTFNNWDGSDFMYDTDGDGIYTVMVNNITVGAIEYKFYYKDINGIDRWEEIPNRKANIMANTILDPVFFMDDKGGAVKLTVHFSVNMELEIQAGRFKPASDVVYVRGNFNSWNATDKCTPHPFFPNIYEKDIDFLAKVGDTIHYKFCINDSKWENDFPKNNGGHRLIGFSQTDLNNKKASDPFKYPSEMFNGLIGSALTQQAIDITFTVNMDKATDLKGNTFPKIENVFICGDASPLGWGWETLYMAKAIFMFDDGTHGDKTAKDNIWSIKVTFPKYSTLKAFNYKYGANFDLPSNNGTNDNENVSGSDHWIQLSNSIKSATVNNVFGVATTSEKPHPFESVISGIDRNNNVVPAQFSIDQNYPNPFNPSTKINFTVASPSNVNITIYDIMGREVKTLLKNNLNVGSYSVVFDANNTGITIASGIYLCKIYAFSLDGGPNSFTKTIKMSLLK